MVCVQPGGFGPLKPEDLSSGQFSTWSTVQQSPGSTPPGWSGPAVVSFSNNNRTVIPITPGSVLRVTGEGRNTGKLYYEITAAAALTDSPNVLVGFFRADQTGPLVGANSGFGMTSATQWWGIYRDGTWVGQITQAANGDIIGVSLDFDSDPGNVLVNFRVNGYWWNTGTVSYAFNDTALVAYPTSGLLVHPAANCSSSGPVTLNVGNASFRDWRPPGYTPWR